MHKLIYLPLPRYQSRYTEFTSGENGMFAMGVKDYSRHPVELEIVPAGEAVKQLESGIAVDTVGFPEIAFQQTLELLKMIKSGKITNDSVIYIEDFWWPGMEMIPYACHFAGVKPKVFALCYAQSVDPTDFTFPMRKWIRHFEAGWAEWLTGIFVASEQHKRMLERIIPQFRHKTYVTGLPLDWRGYTKLLYSGQTKLHYREKRIPMVIYAARFDPEKNPGFFLDIAKAHLGSPFQFVMCSGRQIPKEWKTAAEEAKVVIREGLTKQDYFRLLCQASVLINTGQHDNFCYILYDALAYGCYPLFPARRIFPDSLHRDERFLYKHLDVKDAHEKLLALRDEQKDNYQFYEGDPRPPLWNKFASKYERTVARMIDIMFGDPPIGNVINDAVSVQESKLQDARHIENDEEWASDFRWAQLHKERLKL